MHKSCWSCRCEGQRQSKGPLQHNCREVDGNSIKFTWSVGFSTGGVDFGTCLYSKLQAWLTRLPLAHPLCPEKDSQSRQSLLINQVQQQASELTAAAAAMPMRIQRIDTLLEQLEAGDIKLRVRTGVAGGKVG